MSVAALSAGTETLFFSSSLTLLVMACVSLALACLFRLRFRKLNSVVCEPSVSVTSRTFNVYDPYPDRWKAINSFLTLMPLVVLACTGAIVLLFMEIVATGLLLSLVIFVVCLNLLVVEGAFDVYQTGKTFVAAFQRGTGLGEGDLKVYRIVRNALPRISNYCFGLAIGFALFGLALPYIAPSLSWGFFQLMNLVFRGGVAMGFSPFATPLLWTVSIVAIVILIRRIKSRFSETIFAQRL